MSSRSFRRYQGRGKGSLRSCEGGLVGCGSDIGISETEGGKRLHTQLGKDIPKPVQNEHRGESVSVRWVREVR